MIQKELDIHTKLLAATIEVEEALELSEQPNVASAGPWLLRLRLACSTLGIAE